MVITATKKFNWAMAHLLEDHCGLCKFCHGHNYKLEVTVKKEKDIFGLNEDKENKSNKGMVIDFTDLKNIVQLKIVDYFDHSFCYNACNIKSKKIADFLLNEIQQKLAPLPNRVTAENMAEWIFKTLQQEFVTKNINVIKIKLYETDTSFVEYTA